MISDSNPGADIYILTSHSSIIFCIFYFLFIYLFFDQWGNTVDQREHLLQWWQELKS